MNIRNILRIVPTLAVSTIAGLGSGVATAGGLLDIEFNPFNLTNPPTVSNSYWPIFPGGAATVLIYLGETEDGCVFNKISASPGDTRTFMNSEPGYEDYDGVVAQVIVDREWEVEVECEEIIANYDLSAWEPEAEDIGEWTLDWLVDDLFGNTWYMGEASRDFGDGCPTEAAVPFGAPMAAWPSDELFFQCTEGSWEAGQLGQADMEIIGEAGIVVPSDDPYGTGEPLTAGNYWLQEVAENAEDMAKLLRKYAPVSVDEGQFAGDYEGCRKVKEWAAADISGSIEHKYYCEGEGLLMIEGVAGGKTEYEFLIYASP